MRFSRVMAVTSLVLAAACKSSTGYSSGGGGGGGGPAPNQVLMQSSTFNPSTLTVSVGTTVTFMNQDGYAHTVTYSSGPGSSFNSGSVAGGGSFAHAFTVAGTYQYYCTIHGTPTSGMRGTVVAQ